MNVDWAQVALLVAVLVPSVILHEVAHGCAALALGDDTAQRAGRLTLNPLRHVDPFGTVALPLLLSLSGLGVFGYAKPVPVTVGRLRRPRQDALWVSLAGPAANVALALVAAVAFRRWFGTAAGGAVVLEAGWAARALFFFGLVNVVLAVFNLLPVPPLDGSALVERVLPARWWPHWVRLRRWSLAVLLLVVLAVPGALSRVLEPAVRLWARLL